MITGEYTDLFIEHFPFWGNLSQSEKEFLSFNTKTANYKKGDILHGGNEDCVGVIIVKKGQLRTYMLSDEGKEITLYRLYKDDVCVMSASCIYEAITFDVFVEAVEDCEILITAAKAFDKLSRQNIYVEAFSYKLATTRFSDVMWTMQQILFMSFDRRLAIFLLDEANKTGLDEIKLTHEQIAKLMGSAREVVTRMLKYFTEEKIVSVSRGVIKITDKNKLRRLT